MAQAVSYYEEGLQPDCGIPPANIRVHLVSFLNDWPPGVARYQSVEMEDYVHGVLMGELGPTVPQGQYSGEQWDLEAIKAKAVIARTYGSYNCQNPLPDGTTGITNSTNDQAYRPLYPDFPLNERTRFRNLAAVTGGMYISYDGTKLEAPYNGVLPETPFKNDVGNPTNTLTLINNQPNYQSGYQHLYSVNNPYAEIQTPHQGGFGQLSAHTWTQSHDRSTSWYNMLVYYYTGVQVMQKNNWYYARYWNNRDCSGNPTTGKWLPEINNDWAYNAPTSGINSDNFCLEWNGNYQYFPEDSWYTFFITADDGFELYVSNQLILSKWQDQPPTQYSVSLPLSQGYHTVRFKYYEHGGMAVARMNWIKGQGMVGTYYDSVISKTGHLAEPIRIQRPDPVIKFAWNELSPLNINQDWEELYGNGRDQTPSIHPDTFSARWQGHIYIPSCRTNTFSTRSDDGVYLKIVHAPSLAPVGAKEGADGNHEALIDQWNDHSPTNHSSSRYLCPGTYPLEMRYYENSGWAVAHLSWQ